MWRDWAKKLQQNHNDELAAVLMVRDVCDGFQFVSPSSAEQDVVHVLVFKRVNNGGRDDGYYPV